LIVQTVPHHSTDVDLIVENARATSFVAIDCRGPPTFAPGSENSFFVQRLSVLFEAFAREFVAEVNCHRREQSEQKRNAEAELQKIKGQIEKLVDAIIKGANAMAVNAKLKELEAQQAALEQELKDAPGEQPLLHPNLSVLYRQQVERLEDLLADPELGHEAIDQLRGLIDRVNLVPSEGELMIELHGDLAGILACAADQREPSHHSEQRALQIKVVAGACNHLDLQLKSLLQAIDS